MKCDAEIACPINLISITIPSAPEPSLGILPVIDELQTRDSISAIPPSTD